MDEFESVWEHALAGLKEKRLFRVLRPAVRLPGAKIRFVDGPELVDFSSNDYLGLSHHPRMIEAARAYAQEFGVGAGASRLVSGNLAPIVEIERKLAAAKQMQAALVFVSGAQANLTILPALLDARVLGAEPLVYTDRLNHASLIQGCVAAGVKQIRFRHNDLGHLQDLLERDSAQDRPRFIITESVFSMDGDGPDIAALAALAERFKAFLYIDEAHATGVLGQNGFGLACGLNNALIMGTFSKGLGGFGAYAACSAVMRDYLINRCGGLIYATSLPPSVLGTMNESLDLVGIMAAERQHLQLMAESLRTRLRQAGLNTGASTTQIVPLILEDAEFCLNLAKALEQDGFCAVAIRPPTVPSGTSRLRLAVSALHQASEIQALADAIISRCR